MSPSRVRFDALVDRGAREPLPPIDVAARVVGIIETTELPPAAFSPAWWAAGLSVAAALVVLLLASYQGALFEDPFTDWLRSLVVVMQ
jgi:hypothetical protein